MRLERKEERSPESNRAGGKVAKRSRLGEGMTLKRDEEDMLRERVGNGETARRLSVSRSRTMRHSRAGLRRR